jgi:putative transposase
MSTLDYKLFYKRYLPHYQPPGATIFITFRLTGSLPMKVLKQLAAETVLQETGLSKIQDEIKRNHAASNIRKQFFVKWDAELDSGRRGPQWLAEPEIARLVCDAMHFNDGKQYELLAYCIMPNHVHMVCTPSRSNDVFVPLAKILQSLKGFTAREANKILERTGDFWQHESYDHVVRDNKELERIVFYVIKNPVKAGLPVEYVYCHPDFGYLDDRL